MSRLIDSFFNSTRAASYTGQHLRLDKIRKYNSFHLTIHPEAGTITSLFQMRKSEVQESVVRSLPNVIKSKLSVGAWT